MPVDMAMALEVSFDSIFRLLAGSSKFKVQRGSDDVAICPKGSFPVYRTYTQSKLALIPVAD